MGAGPAGLVLALDLVQSGVNVRVIEKSQGIFVGQRGAGIMVKTHNPIVESKLTLSQPRSIEVYEALGVLEDIQKLAIPISRLKACKVGQGDANIHGITEMFPYIEPTPSRPYVSVTFSKSHFH